MITLSQVLIGVGIWTIISLLVCLPICNYIIDNTDHEELAYLVYPIWVILSIVGLGIYLN